MAGVTGLVTTGIGIMAVVATMVVRSMVMAAVTVMAVAMGMAVAMATAAAVAETITTDNARRTKKKAVLLMRDGLLICCEAKLPVENVTLLRPEASCRRLRR
jgi:2-methylaconitate cis-trans-isomerase PrpF